MKRKTWGALAFGLALVLFCGETRAAGTVSCAVESNDANTGVTITNCTCTGDASDGSFPATAFSLPYPTMYLLRVVTDPGATAPTDNYDITITDGDGLDVMGGALANRDEANTEDAVPKDSAGVARYPDIRKGLTLTITNSSVNSAVIEVKVHAYAP